MVRNHSPCAGYGTSNLWKVGALSSAETFIAMSLPPGQRDASSRSSSRSRAKNNWSSLGLFWMLDGVWAGNSEDGEVEMGSHSGDETATVTKTGLQVNRLGAYSRQLQNRSGTNCCHIFLFTFHIFIFRYVCMYLFISRITLSFKISHFIPT